MQNWEDILMKDKVDEIIRSNRKSKISYYISPLWIKITIIIFLILAFFEHHLS